MLSQSAIDDWFSLSARRNRKSFFYASLLLILVNIIITLLFQFFEVSGRAELILSIVFGLPWLFVSFNLCAQRLRDFNITGWLALLWIPNGFLYMQSYFLGAGITMAFWIILLSIPGTNGQNRYGRDPLQKWE